MLKRFALALTLFALASGASAQAHGDLSFHRTVAGPTELIQRTVVLPVPPPPPPGSQTGPSLVTAGAGVQLSAQHSQSLEAFYGHFPGMHVVAPATPADAIGTMYSACPAVTPSPPPGSCRLCVTS